MLKNRVHEINIWKTSSLLILDWTTGWSLSIPAAIMKALSPLQAIELVAIVTAVVSFGVWTITSHLDFAISWSIQFGADSYNE